LNYTWLSNITGNISLMMPAKNLQVLKIDPVEVLSFKGPFTEVVTSSITLMNPTDDKIAFKVKTTAPKRYCVRPNSGILKKDESITVSVMLQPFEFDPAEKTKQKFMIQSIVMEGEVTESDVWKDTDPQKLMDTKLRVVFDMESAAAADTPATTLSDPAPNTLSTAPDGTVDSTTTSAAPATAADTQRTSASKKDSGKENTEDGYNRALDENQKLIQEVASLKEESQRLRRIAMNDTISAGTQKSSQSQQELPSGVGLLFQDMNNLILLVVLFIVTFGAGIFLSPSIL